MSRIFTVWENVRQGAENLVRTFRSWFGPFLFESRKETADLHRTAWKGLGRFLGKDLLKEGESFIVRGLIKPGRQPVSDFIRRIGRLGDNNNNNDKNSNNNN